MGRAIQQSRVNHPSGGRFRLASSPCRFAPLCWCLVFPWRTALTLSDKSQRHPCIPPGKDGDGACPAVFPDTNTISAASSGIVKEGIFAARLRRGRLGIYPGSQPYPTVAGLSLFTTMLLLRCNIDNAALLWVETADCEKVPSDA